MRPEDRLRELYAAFNARDVEAFLAALTEDVDWPDTWEGGRLHGAESVRSYWLRQWSEIEPVEIFAQPDGDLVARMEVEEP